MLSKINVNNAYILPVSQMRQLAKEYYGMSTPTHKPVKSLEKMAKQDAYDWARAEMFFGEGAGIRRRHLQAQIIEKMEQFPGYEALYQKHYARQDMIKHAEKALQERKKIDRSIKANKNFRALKSGNYTALSNGVFIAVGVAYVAHATGYDKKVVAEGKKLYRKAKAEVKFRKAKREGRNVEKLY